MFLLIGSTKTATTSIDRAVRETGKFKFIKGIKESNYFINAPVVLGENKLFSWQQIPDISYEDYLQRFVGSGDSFEACTSYFHFAEEFIYKLKELNVDLNEFKIILILRSPHSRAKSAFLHGLRDKTEIDCLYDALLQDFCGERKERWFMERYFSMSLYYKNVSLLIENLPNIKILSYDALMFDQSTFMNEIGKTMNVDFNSLSHLNCSENKFGRFDLYYSDFVSQIKKIIKVFLSLRSILSNNCSSDVELNFPDSCVYAWLDDLNKVQEIFNSDNVDEWISQLKSGCCLDDNNTQFNPVLYKQGKV
ncbi:MAG: hypothetical protein JXR18_12225 [Neptuniibacter sp.]